jgi:hypothetical protein
MDVKKVVKEINPHILGLSECELKQNNQSDQLKKLKVPGYKLLLPKSWEMHGYAHVAVYVNKTLDYLINNQKEKLELFLNQWDHALSHGNPSEPNDIFVLCDMNIDSYEEKWLNPNYHLYSLSQLVHRACNTNNLSQLVKDITSPA